MRKITKLEFKRSVKVLLNSFLNVLLYISAGIFYCFILMVISAKILNIDIYHNDKHIFDDCFIYCS